MTTLPIQDAIQKHMPRELHHKLLEAQGMMNHDSATSIESGIRNAEHIAATLGMASAGFGNKHQIGDADPDTLKRMSEYVSGVADAGREKLAAAQRREVVR